MLRALLALLLAAAIIAGAGWLLGWWGAVLAAVWLAVVATSEAVRVNRQAWR